MRMAVAVASRATCRRRKVGSVLVQNGSVRGTGYNGAPAGVPDCLEVDCMTDEQGRCSRAIHAEINLILQTTPSERENATVFVTDRPCWECGKALANSGIRRIVYLRPHGRNLDRLQAMLAAKEIALEHYMPQLSVDLEPVMDPTATERVDQPANSNNS